MDDTEKSVKLTRLANGWTVTVNRYLADETYVFSDWDAMMKFVRSQISFGALDQQPEISECPSCHATGLSELFQRKK